MNNFRSLKISFLFPLLHLASFSFFLILGCSPKKVKNLSSTDENNSKENNAEWIIEFSEDFSEVETGSEPESLFILDGVYTVEVDQNDEKILSLPGSPMGDFGLLFGPRIREKDLELRFSFFSTKQGRRMPSIAAGIGGVRGLRLRLNPAVKNLVLTFDDQTLKEFPFPGREINGGQFAFECHLKIQINPLLFDASFGQSKKWNLTIG